jgi:hypothetical protein
VLGDFPVGEGRTCGRKLCDDCSHLNRPGLHSCDAYHRQWREFRQSGGLVRELEKVEPFKGR